eukprot:gene8493-1519_t
MGMSRKRMVLAVAAVSLLYVVGLAAHHKLAATSSGAALPPVASGAASTDLARLTAVAADHATALAEASKTIAAIRTLANVPAAPALERGTRKSPIAASYVRSLPTLLARHRALVSEALRTARELRGLVNGTEPPPGDSSGNAPMAADPAISVGTKTPSQAASSGASTAAAQEQSSAATQPSPPPLPSHRPLPPPPPPPDWLIDVDMGRSYGSAAPDTALQAPPPLVHATYPVPGSYIPPGGSCVVCTVGMWWCFHSKTALSPLALYQQLACIAPTWAHSAPGTCSLSSSTGTNRGLTLVLLAYSRLEHLPRSMKHYASCPSVSHVLIVWNNVDQPPEEAIRKTAEAEAAAHGVPVTIVPQQANTLNNRYFVHDKIQTAAVMFSDDEAVQVLYDHDSIAKSLMIWQRSPERLLGFFPRNISATRYDGGTSTPLSEYNMVIGRGLMMHRDLLEHYSQSKHSELHHLVDEKFCDDIVLNYVSSALTGLPPLLVPVVYEDLPEQTASYKGLSQGGQSWFQKRHDCTKHLYDHFKSTPPTESNLAFVSREPDMGSATGSGAGQGGPVYPCEGPAAEFYTTFLTPRRQTWITGFKWVSEHPHP